MYVNTFLCVRSQMPLCIILVRYFDRFLGLGLLLSFVICNFDFELRLMKI